MSRTTEHAGSILQLSQGMLHCLLKSALALEIDASGGHCGIVDGFIQLPVCCFTASLRLFWQPSYMLPLVCFTLRSQACASPPPVLPARTCSLCQ